MGALVTGRRHELQPHSPPGSRQRIEPQASQRSWPPEHSQPAYRLDDRGQPRPWQTAYEGSTTSPSTGQTARQRLQSLRSRGSTS